MLLVLVCFVFFWWGFGSALLWFVVVSVLGRCVWLCCAWVWCFFVAGCFSFFGFGVVIVGGCGWCGVGGLVVVCVWLCDGFAGFVVSGLVAVDLWVVLLLCGVVCLGLSVGLGFGVLLWGLVGCCWFWVGFCLGSVFWVVVCLLCVLLLGVVCMCFVLDVWFLGWLWWVGFLWFCFVVLVLGGFLVVGCC